MVNGSFAEYIRLYGFKHPINIAAANDLAMQYSDIALPTEMLKVTNGTEMNIRCIVPFIGHHIGYGHTTEEE